MNMSIQLTMNVVNAHLGMCCQLKRNTGLITLRLIISVYLKKIQFQENKTKIKAQLSSAIDVSVFYG